MRDPRPAKAEWIQPSLSTLERNPTAKTKETSQPSRGPLSNSTPSANAPLRTLIVDDFQDAAQSLAELMRCWGHAATTMRNGCDALRLWRDFDVILLELALPDMDGCELVRRIREESTQAWPFFIAVTTEGQENRVRRGEESGINLHLLKPIEPAVLRGILERLSELIASIRA